MNMNETCRLLGRTRGRGRGRSLQVMPIQRALMGPPESVPRKSKPSASFASSSSHIKWRSHSTNSFKKNSPACNTGSSTWTRSSTETESQVILALSEGRGKAICEVGIAALNISQSTLILCQISDTHSYVNTLTKINVMNPTEILIPLTFVETCNANRLLDKVKEQFTNVKITGVNRSTFNKNNGLQYAKQLCVPNMNSVLLVLQHRYYALAAASAIFSYAEANLYVIYAKESIKIEYQESEGYAVIDVATAERLELVVSARPTIKKKYSCLLDIMNYCCTKVGALALRASILQPPCVVKDIEARLDCVTELKENGEVLSAIQTVLQKFASVDQLLTLAVILPDHAQNCSERQLNYLLSLNSLLKQFSYLQDIFQNFKQPFFAELNATINDPGLTEVKNVLLTLINSDAYYAKGKYGLIQRCFAIKSGVNPLLDLVRKSYSERLDEMREYVNELGKTHSLSLTLNNSQQKGYHIVLRLNAHQKKTMKKSDIPDEFLQVDRLASSFTMKTQTLIDLSSRVEDINLEVLKISNIMIYNLLIEIKKYMGLFHSLCENISKLDMIQALAQASSNMNYVRPKFSNYLEVQHGRHPLLNFLHAVEPVGNSFSASDEYNMHIITGPNGSGKSIFIRQIVLLQIMAQVGCYVPAEAATFRVADRILARLSFEDNMACGVSAFALEMKEIQYFLTVLTKNTLIIIDELCRSTAVVEGTALAMAICERFMQTPAFVFFTTHFKLLTKLYDLHLNVKLWQMETIAEVVNKQSILHFTYNTIPGVTSLARYGLFLAKSTWPESIIKCVENVLDQLSSKQKSLQFEDQIHPALRLKYDLDSNFKMLRNKGILTRAIIDRNLTEYKGNLIQLGYFHADEVDGVHPVVRNNPVEEFRLPIIEHSFNDTGNIYQYYNNDQPNTSYQNLSQELSIILQDKLNSSHQINNKFTRNMLEGIDEDEEHDLSDEVIEQDEVQYSFNQSYVPIFEPEVLVRTANELELNFSQMSVEKESIFQPKELFPRGNDSFSTIHNDSIESMNQLRFSLPLQQNIERTSTPLVTSFQPSVKAILNLPVPSKKVNASISDLWEQADADIDEIVLSNYLDSVEEELLGSQKKSSDADQNQSMASNWMNFTINVETGEELKKSSTESSSIKWMGYSSIKSANNRQIINSYQNSTTGKILTSNQNTTSNFLNWRDRDETVLSDSYRIASLPEESPLNKIDSKSNQNFQPTHGNAEDTKIASASSVRRLEIDAKEQRDKSQEPCTPNVTWQSQFTEAELAEITKELESCSEFFLDSDDWVAKASDNNDCDLSTVSSLHTGYGGVVHTVVVDVHPVKYVSPRKNSPELKKNQLESNIAVDDNAVVNVLEENNTQNVLPETQNVELPESSQTTNAVHTKNSPELKKNQLKNNTAVDENAIVNVLEENNTQNVLPKAQNVELPESSQTINAVTVNNTTLESLGDIHLELFSDDSDPENGKSQINNKPESQKNNSQMEAIANICSPPLFLTPTTPTSPVATGVNKNSCTISKIEKSVADSCESQTSLTRKKPKWNPPYKTQNQVNTVSDKNDVQDEENPCEEDLESRLKNIVTRPTYKQIQQLECIASFKKTEHGMIVLPTENKTRKLKRNRFISPMLKRKSEEFDVTLLSDKKVQKFEDYLNASKKSSPLIRTEMSSFQFTRGEVASKAMEKPDSFDEDFSNYGRNITKFKDTLLKKIQNSIGENSQNLIEEKENVGPGYYTQNKEHIDKLVHKYLNSSEKKSQDNVENKCNRSSIFNDVTLEYPSP